MARPFQKLFHTLITTRQPFTPRRLSLKQSHVYGSCSALEGFGFHRRFQPISSFSTRSRNFDNQEEDIEVIDPEAYEAIFSADNEEEPVDTDWFVDNASEEFVPMWQRVAINDHLQGRSSLQQASAILMETGDISIDSIRELLEKAKMDDIQVLDLKGKCDWTDYMIIAESAKGDRFLSNVAENLSQMIRKTIREHPKELAEHPMPHVEGRDDNSGWLLIDLGKCVVHLFTPEMRKHYDIEGLWNSVPKYDSLSSAE